MEVPVRYSLLMTGLSRRQNKAMVGCAMRSMQPQKPVS